MASTKTNTPAAVRLTGPATWRVWDKQFRTRAVAKDLWELINPDSPHRGQFRVRPTKPNPAEYASVDDPPARARGGRNQGAAAEEDPAPLKSQKQYQDDRTEYQYDLRVYQAEREKVAHLIDWVTESVSPAIFDNACDPDNPLDQWYTALKA